MGRTGFRRLYRKPTCFEGLPDGAQREARTFLSGGADERRCPLMAFLASCTSAQSPLSRGGMRPPSVGTGAQQKVLGVLTPGALRISKWRVPPELGLR
jgi:hypothetical protein